MRNAATVTVLCLGLFTACTDVIAPTARQVEPPAFSNGSSDVTPPALTAFSFAPTTINTTEGAAEVTVAFTVSDDLSGAILFCASFRGPVRRVEEGSCTGFPAATLHSGSLVVSFPRFSEAGTWQLESAVIHDAVGNGVSLSAGDLAARGFPTSLVVESVSDVTPPALTAFSFAPTTINTTEGAAEVTVAFTVSDDLSGAILFCASFRGPVRRVEEGSCTGFPAATLHSGSLVVSFPRFSEAGTWQLESAVIHDAVGNGVSLSAADLAARGFPTSLVIQNTLEVTIDVVPLLSPNIVFPRSRLPIPVAVVTTTDFNAGTVNVSSLRFGATGTEVGPAHSKVIDFDRDGDLDLLLLFPTQGSGIVCGATSARVTGRTSAGQPIEGTDVIRTSGCR